MLAILMLPELSQLEFISSKLTTELIIKTPERRQWRRSDVFIVNFENISHLLLVFPLLTLSR